MFTISKLLFVASSFLIIGYNSLSFLPLWSYPFYFGIYLFMLSPSIIHFLYFISSLQKCILEQEFYKISSIIAKFIIMMALFIFPFLFVAITSFIMKGISFSYLLSLNSLGIFIYSIKIKKYAYGPLLIYDFGITIILVVLSLFLPIMNFAPISFK